NTACCTINMRFTSLSINIHIIDWKYKKYSAHFMMWLNSYLSVKSGQAGSQISFVVHQRHQPL
ncbi:hypothetical protein P9848_04290, partial [Geobacillus stearothermophilus]|uniref:hypothetical protein n=1 Tax=Geobacillus stearothermophilus TaxID=1422 RepID=UPI002E20FF06|nr:hypothetical protein [Geobacillus stearothermophilus]